MAQCIRVLIVDDSAHARVGLRALLATLPEVEVIGEATNGEHALKCIAASHPEVVLMDVQMPIMDGLEATRQIKKRWPDITIIMLTMYGARQRAAQEAGADVFVVKGSDPERLVAALDAAKMLSHG